MKCHECGNIITTHIGDLELPSKTLGSFSIYNVEYFKCNHCDSIFLPENTWNIADKEENKLVNDYLSNLPIKKFIASSTTADLLGMSRQALHKHKRIQRGFIYSILHEGNRFYLNDSVLLFKQNGDGRYPLIKQNNKKEKIKYIVVADSNSERKNQYHKENIVNNRFGWIKTDINNSSSKKGSEYVANN